MSIKSVLTLFKFEHKEAEYYEGSVIIEESWETSREAGSLQYLPRLKKLFIWSGMGLGTYIDKEDDSNHGYGFEVAIQDETHLQNVIVTLLYTPAKEVGTVGSDEYLFDVTKEEK